MTTTSIDHDTERELSAGTGHQHSCWEAFAEQAVEAAAARGLVLTGRHDDEVDGRLLWELFEAADPMTCYNGCFRPVDEE